MLTEYRSHGTFDIKVCNNLLIVDSKGPFNKEIVADYLNAMKEAMAHFNKHPWRQIIIMREDNIFTPEAIEQMIKATQYRQARGLIFSAVAFLVSDGRSIMEHQLKSIYTKTHLAHRFFDNYNDARQYISLLEQQEK